MTGMTPEALEALSKKLADHQHMIQRDGLAAMLETALGAARAISDIADQLRTGKLVMVDDGAVERVKTAMLARKFSDGGHLIERRRHCSSEMIADELATAAIAALKGEK